MSENIKNSQIKEDSKENQGKQDLANSNIFDDFSLDDELKNEVDTFEKKNNKTLFDYSIKYSLVFRVLNLLFFIAVLVVSFYVYIQNDDQKKDVSRMDPFCNFFISDIPLLPDTTYCSSISYTKKWYEKILEDTKSSIYKELAPIAISLYELKNFNNSKEVVFLIDKSINRLKPLDILDQFDTLKNNFSRLDKERISCSSFSIDSNLSISVSCTAKSPWTWEKSIPWYNWIVSWFWSKSVSWTSISLALSFINYLKLNSDKFIVESENTSFSKPSTTRDNFTWEFFNETSFSLKLKYNNLDLSL